MSANGCCEGRCLVNAVQLTDDKAKGSRREPDSQPSIKSSVSSERVTASVVQRSNPHRPFAPRGPGLGKGSRPSRGGGDGGYDAAHAPRGCHTAPAHPGTARLGRKAMHRLRRLHRLHSSCAHCSDGGTCGVKPRSAASADGLSAPAGAGLQLRAVARVVGAAAGGAILGAAAARWASRRRGGDRT